MLCGNSLKKTDVEGKWKEKNSRTAKITDTGLYEGQDNKLKIQKN